MAEKPGVFGPIDVTFEVDGKRKIIRTVGHASPIDLAEIDGRRRVPGYLLQREDDHRVGLGEDSLMVITGDRAGVNHPLYERGKDGVYRPQPGTRVTGVNWIVKAR